MKIYLSSLLNSCPKSTYQKVFRHFFSSASTLRTTFSSKGSGLLYRRISPLGDPNISIVPVLDQWVEEGRSVNKEELQTIINELKVYRRFKHALEISLWMTDKRYIPPTPADIATRLNLIYRVHGLEQVENYFNNIPLQLKGFDIYTALLNCYVHDKNVEKAEAIMQKLRDMGRARGPLTYNIMMKLFYHVENWEKLDALMHEMEEKGICFDNYTYGIRLSAYATASDAEGIEKIVTMMESDPWIVLDCDSYAVAANGYLKAGLTEEALEMLNKLEKLMATTKKKNAAFDFLLKLYAEVGKTSELYRIWNLYKKNRKVLNKGYISMMGSLLKCNDIEGAENVFEEWESRGLSYDFRIPNFLIDTYCRNGLLEKAEALLNRGVGKGGNPTANTWYCLVGGYISDNRIPEAVEALKKTISLCPANWKPSKDTLATCLKFLERKGNVDEAEDFIRLLKVEGVFSAAIHDILFSFIEDNGKSQS